MGRFRFRWKNFRSFKDTNWICVKPITIVIGANNSGKTSLLAPLLAMKQTCDSDDTSVSLKTSGPLIDIGLYRDYIYRHRQQQQVEFNLEFSHHNPFRKNKTEKPKKIGTYPPVCLRTRFEVDEASGGAKLSLYELTDPLNRTMLTREYIEKDKYSLNFFKKLPRYKEPVNSAVQKDIESQKPENFLFKGWTVLNEVIRSVENKVTSTKKKKKFTKKIEIDLSDDLFVCIAAADFIYRHVVNLLDYICYLGPIREHPKRIYESPGDKPDNVGVRGEYAPEILFQDRDKKLTKKINRLFSNLKIADSIDCKQIRKGIYYINVSSVGSISSNLSDTGFGFSQILPLVVEGFNSPKHSVLIAEQPEIHLNPALQCKLADILASIKENNKSIIVETHSEHLILRLRQLIACGDIKADEVSIYFVEKNRGVSTVREIPIKDNGHVEPVYWPKGFMEESVREALNLASMQRKKRGRSK